MFPYKSRRIAAKERCNRNFFCLFLPPSSLPLTTPPHHHQRPFTRRRVGRGNGALSWSKISPPPFSLKRMDESGGDKKSFGHSPPVPTYPHYRRRTKKNPFFGTVGFKRQKGGNWSVFFCSVIKTKKRVFLFFYWETL